MSHGATVSGALNCTNDLPTFKNCTKNVTLGNKLARDSYCKYIQDTYDCFPSKRPDRALTPDRAPDETGSAAALLSTAEELACRERGARALRSPMDSALCAAQRVRRALGCSD